MARINLDDWSVSDLVALEAKLKTAIDDARDRNRVKIRGKLSALAEQHGFSASELFGGRREVARKKPAKVAAKYANPSDRKQTWTGRGRRPRWLTEEMKKGRKLKDFAM